MKKEMFFDALVKVFYLVGTSVVIGSLVAIGIMFITVLLDVYGI